MTLHPNTVFVVPANKRVLNGQPPAQIGTGPGWGRAFVPLLMVAVMVIGMANSDTFRTTALLTLGRAQTVLDSARAETYRELYSDGRLVYRYNVVGSYTVGGQSYTLRQLTDEPTQRAYDEGTRRTVEYATANPALSTLDYAADVREQWWMFALVVFFLGLLVYALWRAWRNQREAAALIRSGVVVQGVVEQADFQMGPGNRSVLLNIAYSYTTPRHANVMANRWSGPMRVNVPPPGTPVAVLLVQTSMGEQATLL